MADTKNVELGYKKFLLEHGKKGTVTSQSARKKVEITQDVKSYKKGQVINPQTLWADHLIKLGVAKEVREKKK